MALQHWYFCNNWQQFFHAESFKQVRIGTHAERKLKICPWDHGSKWRKCSDLVRLKLCSDSARWERSTAVWPVPERWRIRPRRREKNMKKHRKRGCGRGHCLGGQDMSGHHIMVPFLVDVAQWIGYLWWETGDWPIQAGMTDTGCKSLCWGVWPIVACDVRICTQAFMSAHVARLVDVLDFVRGGVTSNFWGLACPTWCGAPSWTTILLSFGAGISVGLLLAISGLLLALYLFGIVRAPVTSVTSSTFLHPEGLHPRLRGYLHGIWQLRGLGCYPRSTNTSSWSHLGCEPCGWGHCCPSRFTCASGGGWHFCVSGGLALSVSCFCGFNLYISGLQPAGLGDPSNPWFGQVFGFFFAAWSCRFWWPSSACLADWSVGKVCASREDQSS